MKKKKLKQLNLNKNVITKFNQRTVNGGATINGCPTNFTCPTGLPCDIGISLLNGTKGDCVQTWGDPGCITGIRGICVADDNLRDRN